LNFGLFILRSLAIDCKSNYSQLILTTEKLKWAEPILYKSNHNQLTECAGIPKSKVLVNDIKDLKAQGLKDSIDSLAHDYFAYGENYQKAV